MKEKSKKRGEERRGVNGIGPIELEVRKFQFDWSIRARDKEGRSKRKKTKMKENKQNLGKLERERKKRRINEIGTTEFKIPLVDQDARKRERMKSHENTHGREIDLRERERKKQKFQKEKNMKKKSRKRVEKERKN